MPYWTDCRLLLHLPLARSVPHKRSRGSVGGVGGSSFAGRLNGMRVQLIPVAASSRCSSGVAGSRDLRQRSWYH